MNATPDDPNDERPEIPPDDPRNWRNSRLQHWDCRYAYEAVGDASVRPEHSGRIPPDFRKAWLTRLSRRRAMRYWHPN